MDTQCAPGVDYINSSCILLPVLVELVKAYNDDNQSSLITFNESLITINPSQLKKYLIEEMTNRHEGICETQSCWIKQKYVNRMQPIYREQLTKGTFRPVGPQGKFEWLSTPHIYDTMSQYEKVNPDFKFLGAVPMDFDSLPAYGIKDINFGEYESAGKTKFGIVFNLDNHDQSGSHWVAMYFDVISGEILFSDSVGIAPPARVRVLMRRIAKYISSKNRQLKADHNTTEHQQGDSECGVYSINFILRMLGGETFQDYIKDRISDSEVNKCRDVYFRKK